MEWEPQERLVESGGGVEGVVAPEGDGTSGERPDEERLNDDGFDEKKLGGGLRRRKLGWKS